MERAYKHIVSFLVPDAVLLALIRFDWKASRNYRPYLVSLGLLSASHLSWYLLPETVVWQVMNQ